MIIEAFTGLESIKYDNETCFICGRPAESVEHIIPKWLQHKFDLWNKQLTLPNDTKITYRQLTVPACKKCNNEVYGGLEQRIHAGTETEADIWRWANKIHFALTLKDNFWEWDRKNRTHKIGDVIAPDDPLELSRHFLHCVSGDFKCDPDPYGSVFRFNFKEPQEYNFIHLINSNSICISLGNRGYVVYVRDGQVMKTRKVIADEYRKLQQKEDLHMYDILFFHAKNIEYMERYNFTVPVMIQEGRITKIGGAIIRSEKPINKELLSAICQKFGFTWVDDGTVY